MSGFQGIRDFKCLQKLLFHVFQDHQVSRCSTFQDFKRSGSKVRSSPFQLFQDFKMIPYAVKNWRCQDFQHSPRYKHFKISTCFRRLVDMQIYKVNHELFQNLQMVKLLKSWTLETMIMSKRLLNIANASYLEISNIHFRQSWTQWTPWSLEHILQSFELLDILQILESLKYLGIFNIHFRERWTSWSSWYLENMPHTYIYIYILYIISKSLKFLNTMKSWRHWKSWQLIHDQSPQINNIFSPPPQKSRIPSHP